MVWELIVGGMVGVGIFLMLKNSWGSVDRKRRRESRKEAGGHTEGARDKEGTTAK
ncbi:MAG: hypothetical protein V1932_05675 [Chloroflexota bacterium]